MAASGGTARNRIMLQILNVIVLLALIGAVLYLLYDRRKTRAAFEELGRGEMVTQAELDSYHHRVVHLYQTQRDWCRGRFEETEHRIRSLENWSKAEPAKPPPSVPDPKPSAETEAPIQTSPIENLSTAETLAPPLSPPKPVNPPPMIEAAPEPDSFDAAEEKVWKAWESGRSIDQIAQDLRMGRQEVQLLIQVSRRRPAGPVGA